MYKDLCLRAVFAGFMISLAGFAYLTLGGVAGACMFAFGLLGVCYMGLNLYTGMAGSVAFRKGDPGVMYHRLGLVLLCNFAGTSAFAALLSQAAGDDALRMLGGIVADRTGAGWLEVLSKAVCCGLVMEVAVYMHKRSGTAFGVLFGVPLFIVCGFYHSIADSFYYALWMFSDGRVEPGALPPLLLAVAGNLLGCNVRRLFM